MRRWAIVALLAVVAAALLYAAGWRDLLAARSHLLSARDTLTAVVNNEASLQSSEGRRQAVTQVDEAFRQITLAEQAVSGLKPVAVAQVVPGLRRQRRGVLDLIDDAGTAARTSRRLLERADALAARTTLTDGAIPLAGLAELETEMRRAGQQLAALERSAAGLWLSLREARREFNQVARETSGRLLRGADAVGAARGFMGERGPRTYFVAVQNNAEMRDQGMVLSYAVARFESGRLRVEKTGSIEDLTLAAPVDVPISDATTQAFGHLSPTQLWQSVNAPADFRWSARTMAAMYQQATGSEVDGVIALDVPALAAVLRTVGPVDVDGIAGALTADTLAPVLLNQLYSQYGPGDRRVRQSLLAEVAAAIIDRVSTGSHDAVALGRDLGRSAAGGHLRLWSKDGDEDAAFSRTGLGGSPADVRPDRTFHVAVQNGTGTKLDYFVKPEVAMEVIVSPLGTAVVRTTVKVVNTAPVGAAPSYQLGPDGYYQERVGQYISRVYLWGPRNTERTGQLVESGLALAQTNLTVEAGQSGTVRFDSIIDDAVRDGRLELRLVPQPRLAAMNLTVKLTAPGWKVTGAPTLSQVWDSRVTVGWGLSR